MNFIDEKKLKNRLIDMDETLNNADAAHVIHGIIDSINNNEFNIHKPLLPESIASYFKELDAFGIEDSWEMLSYLMNIADKLFAEWIKSTEHRQQILLACLIGYEVKKEKKYRVKLPGLIGSNGQQYISKSMDDKLFACAYRDYLEQEFTKEELEEFPNWVQRLEFEEVEDD